MIIPSKILLLGEYTVIKGGQALGIPNQQHTMHWAIDPEKKYLLSFTELIEWIESKNDEWLTYDCHWDFERMKTEILSEYWSLSSTIPEGYGLGSSGAIIVALIKRYASLPILPLTYLKRLLASLECFFHGKSSGIDPLIIFLNTPVRLIDDNTIEPIQALDAIFKYQLIDSNLSRVGKTQIEWFTKEMNHASFQVGVEKLALISTQAIQELIDEDHHFFESLAIISEIQYQYFKPLIPEHIYKTWNSNGIMKLCGAGGGGMFLNFLVD